MRKFIIQYKKLVEKVTVLATLETLSLPLDGILREIDQLSQGFNANTVRRAKRLGYLRFFGC